MPMKKYLYLFFALLICNVCAFAGFAQPSQTSLNRVRSYDVQHYTIRVSFDRAEKSVFGETIISLKPLKDNFRQLELDAAEMNFDSVQLVADNKKIAFKTSNDKIYLTLDKAYSPDDLISIRFKYSVKPNKGIYFVDEETENGKVTRAAQIWTQGEPEEAHHWFPSYDFPDDKATSEQYITVQEGETAIGNGELLEIIKNADGTKTFHYKMPVPHSTYLTSFVVGTYIKVTDAYKNTPLGFYMYPGSEESATQIYGKTKEMMRVYEELTKIEFPYNKYDQTIVANFNFGGMENITATTMADSEIFLNKPDVVEDLVSHELAHSWFGNLVTCRNWAELWLNEGFATYMEAAYREKMYGRADYLRKIRDDAKQFFTDDAVNKNRHALYNKTARPNDALFDVTTYQKGGAVIHTLRETVGTENFWNAINIYLQRYKFQNVETPNLQKAMEETSKMDLNWFFNQWIYRGGYPKIKVEQVYSKREKRLELTITQTQEADKLVPEAFILPMEIEITTSRSVKTEKLQIKKRSEKFSIKLDEEPITIFFDKNEKIPLKSVKVQPLKSIAAGK
ncbi:MAG: M1 family metallopeptidase [Pyrinomonadaceae bacterium]|nr:M1 family metallopeptidase [Pyrinomonadaceae bacterium]